MFLDGLKDHALELAEQGLIKFNPPNGLCESDDPEVIYSPSALLALCKWVDEHATTLEEIQLLVYEFILCHPDGVQMSEEEQALLLYECAFNRLDLNTLLHRFLYQYLEKNCEDFLVVEELKRRGAIYDQVNGERLT